MRGAGKPSSMAALNVARPAAALLVAALALLLAAWVFGNPPGAAPDERAHYVRALGAGSLELEGAIFEPTPEQTEAFFEQRDGPELPGAGVATVLWAAEQTRTFELPAELSVFAFGCNDQEPATSAACVERPTGDRSTRLPTYTGTYPPWSYIVPGRAMRLASTPNAALRAGRLTSALICLALLAAAVALTAAGAEARLALAALGLALTPMAVYCATVLNASGPEIAGSLCFLAAGFRLMRPGAGPAAWAALAAGGAALALSRSLGPVLLVVLGATLLVLAPSRARPRGPALAAGAVLAAAFALAAYWDLAKSPHAVEGGPSYRDALAQTFHDLDDIARHAVGNFGALDTPLPGWLYVAWAVAILVLLGLAAVRGVARERAGLALCLAVAGGITVAVSVFQLRTGYGAQGRHVLPVLVLVPLWAGEVLRRHPAGLAWLPPAVAVLWATGQGVAWLANARRGAVGTDGSWWFAGAAEWSPPGGWWPWAAMALAGAALALAAGVVRRRPV
jgi:hypothetical protein